MKIANVIYEKDLVNHTMVNYVNYINESFEYDKIDKTLPTLYVGWSFMKSCNSNNEIIMKADILKKKIITNELYWEFSFEESKTSHVKGVNTFVNLAPQFYFSPKYIYTNLDPVFFQIKDVQDLMDVLPKKIDTCYNYINEMLYVLSDNKIWGVNLGMYRYFQFNVQDAQTKIADRAKNMISDIDGSYYQSYYKIFPNFINLKRYLVTL
ncbi:hypothetical protein M0Q97_10075 [Candidatus Dojkabacteria bacterium]|jgi:hypothetical protein|nr:hypothetical protein [Candidatus Dojkabacteria bacterium]